MEGGTYGTMATNKRITTWANLNTLRLTPGDIGKARACFRAELGTEAKVIGLNPKNKVLASEVEDYIRIIYCPGILVWECWMSADPTESFVTPVSDRDVLQAQIERKRNKTTALVRTSPGRPPLKLPVKKMLKLKAQGLGSRRIAKELGVSHMSVSRVLRENLKDGEG